jgi:hypothetical protein
VYGITLEHGALNAEFSISYRDLIKFPCFADIPLREGIEGESRPRRRQGDFTDNSNIWLQIIFPIWSFAMPTSHQNLAQACSLYLTLVVAWASSFVIGLLTSSVEEEEEEEGWVRIDRGRKPVIAAVNIKNDTNPNRVCMTFNKRVKNKFRKQDPT